MSADKLENLRAFVFSEHADMRIDKQSATEIVRIIDEVLQEANQPKEEVRLGLVKDFHDKMRGAKSTETQQDNGLREAALTDEDKELIWERLPRWVTEEQVYSYGGRMAWYGAITHPKQRRRLRELFMLNSKKH